VYSLIFFLNWLRKVILRITPVAEQLQEFSVNLYKNSLIFFRNWLRPVIFMITPVAGQRQNFSLNLYKNSFFK